MKYLSSARISALISAIALLPLVASAQSAPRTLGGLADMIANLFNQAGIVLGIVGLAIYFYGIATNILKFGEGNADRLKLYFFWGILVLFLMFSFEGIITLLTNTFFSAGSQVYNPR